MLCASSVTGTVRVQHLDLIAPNVLMTENAWEIAAGFVQCPKLTCITGSDQRSILKMMQWCWCWPR